MQTIIALDREQKDDLHYSSAVTIAREDALKIKSALVDAIERVRGIVKPSAKAVVAACPFTVTVEDASDTVPVTLTWLPLICCPAVGDEMVITGVTRSGNPFGGVLCVQPMTAFKTSSMPTPRFEASV